MGDARRGITALKGLTHCSDWIVLVLLFSSILVLPKGPKQIVAPTSYPTWLYTFFCVHRRLMLPQGAYRIKYRQENGQNNSTCQSYSSYWLCSSSFPFFFFCCFVYKPASIASFPYLRYQWTSFTILLWGLSSWPAHEIGGCRMETLAIAWAYSL